MRQQPRIPIVDDLPAVQTGIRLLLHHNSFRVCGEAADGWKAIDKIVELKPDIRPHVYQYAQDEWCESRLRDRRMLLRTT